MWSSRFKRCHKYNVTNMYILFIFKPFDLREILILTMIWHHKVLKNILLDFGGSKSIYESVPNYWQRWYCSFDTTQNDLKSSNPPHEANNVVAKALTGCTAARKRLQSDFVLTLKHQIKSMGLFIHLYASVAFRSDRNSLLFLSKLNCEKWKEINFLSTRL